MSITHDPTEEDKKEILAACAASTKVTCKVFFPDRFTLPFSKAHDKVFNLLDDDTEQMVAIASWRGFGKTSIMQLGYPTKRALFMDSKFIISGSATYKQALRQSENLKLAISKNQLISELGFKNLKSDVWSQDQWILNTKDGYGCLFLPVSYQQQCRGLIYKNTRPDLYNIDDWEDKESVMSEEQRDKKKRRFITDIFGSVDRSRKDWRICVMGTVLHEDSLLQNLIDNEHWTSLRLELCDDEFISNWPEQMDNDKVWKLYSYYKSEGLVDEFYREYRNICMSPENAPFRADLFQYYLPDQLKNRFLDYVVLVDPAKTVSDTACDTAIVGLAIDIMNGEIYIVDMKCARLHVHEQIDAGLAMCKSLKARVLGVEVTGSGEYIEWSWKSTITERGANVEFVPLKATAGPSQYVPKGSAQQGKDARISQALVPLYNTKKMFHPKEHPLLKKLEDQLLTFPYSKKKDLIDALAYVGGLLHKGERYFANKEAKQTAYGLPGNLDPWAEQRALNRLKREDFNYDRPTYRI